MRTAALILAHGSPSAPAGPEAVLAALARSVAALLPESEVESATLAAPDSLPAALARLEGAARLLVVPHFMSDGWMVSNQIPNRLRAATARPFEVLAPLGRWPATWDLCSERALEAAAGLGADPSETTLLLAAHGSPSDPRPAASAREAARRIAALGRFRAVRCGFIDQAPGIVEEAASIQGPALCLPFFALKAGHVLRDLPRALEAAGFRGPLLDPIGQDSGIPRIIARVLQEARRRAA